VIGKRRNVEVSLADFTENPACEALLAAGYTHALLIPVIAMGEVMGMLALVLTRPARLGAWEEAFLRSMAERVGVAIHRDRLSRELVEKARQLNRHQHEVTGLNHLFVLHQQEEAVCWQRIGAIAQDLLCEVQKLATMHQSLARDQAASFHTTTPAP
jgi:transcriptional regulator with GAF, ATPase, and Fis domain